MKDFDLNGRTFEEVFETGPNRLSPDRVWAVEGEAILALSEAKSSPPILLGCKGSSSFALHPESAAVIVYDIDSFLPAMALRIAPREYWERNFGDDWWSSDKLWRIYLGLRLQGAKAHFLGYQATQKQLAWPVEEVISRAVIFDSEACPDWVDPPSPDQLRPMGYTEFIETKFPATQYILPPFLTLPGLAMLFAERGVGKTMFGSYVAYAAAIGGSFLCWKASRPFRVLILDGEMPIVELQKRYRAIEKAQGIRPNPENLVFLTADQAPDGLPDLGTPDGQKRFEPYLEGFELIVVDNLSTLCRTGAENEADSWGVMQAWAVKQRSAGRSVLLVHHAGKGGAQRGTSRREDVLGTVIQLKHPNGYKQSEGANFEIHFTKARGFFGADAEPLEAHLLPDGSWKHSRLSVAQAEDAVNLYKSGKNMREVANELRISPSTVSGHINDAGIPTRRGRPPKNPPVDQPEDPPEK